jgi:hypothetical protein
VPTIGLEARTAMASPSLFFCLFLGYLVGQHRFDSGTLETAGFPDSFAAPSNYSNDVPPIFFERPNRSSRILEPSFLPVRVKILFKFSLRLRGLHRERFFKTKIGPECAGKSPRRRA